MMHMNAPRYRQTFTDALHAIPLLESGDGLCWDQSASRWRIYALSDGTEFEPELVRVGRNVVAVSMTGLHIMHIAAEHKKLN